MAWTGDDASFQAFIDRHGITFPTISDDDGIVFSRFEVPYQPGLVLIGKDGAVETIIGAVEADFLDDRIASMVDG